MFTIDSILIARHRSVLSEDGHESRFRILEALYSSSSVIMVDKKTSSLDKKGKAERGGRGGEKRTDQDMLPFVGLRLEVEIVHDRIVPSLFDRRQDDLHFELAPTFFSNLKGRISNRFIHTNISQFLSPPPPQTRQKHPKKTPEYNGAEESK